MPDDERSRLGARLRTMREAQGHSLREFSGLINIDYSQLSRMENGQRGIDTLVLRRAAEVLDASLDAFFPSTEGEVVLARKGNVGVDEMNEMIKWAQALRSDLDLVARLSRGTA